MNTQEFSQEFETFLASYLVVQAPGMQDTWAFDEYEKSVFLTYAQIEFVKGLYAGKNINGDAFERTEDIAQLLTPLHDTKTYHVGKMNADGTGNKRNNNTLRAGRNLIHNVFTLPENLMYIFYEEARLDCNLDDCCLAGKTILVQPMRHDDYWKLTRNPFRGPNENRAIRLNFGDNKVEIVSKHKIDTYRVRFIRKPKPIILEKLIDNSIDGYREEMTCELDSSCHRQILEMAVQAAIASKRSAASVIQK